MISTSYFNLGWEITRTVKMNVMRPIALSSTRVVKCIVPVIRGNQLSMISMTVAREQRTISQQDISHSLVHMSIDMSSTSKERECFCPGKDDDCRLEYHAADYS